MNKFFFGKYLTYDSQFYLTYPVLELKLHCGGLLISSTRWIISSVLALFDYLKAH